MSIGTISGTTIYPSAAPAATVNSGSAGAALGYGPGTEYAYLTAQDVAVLEKVTGTSSFDQLNAVDPVILSDTNIQEKYNDFVTSGVTLAQSYATYYLTPGDVALFEGATGTTTSWTL